MRDIMEIQLFTPDRESDYLMLPTSRYEIQDELDRHHISNDFKIRIENCDDVPELAGRIFDGSELDKLQILAQRMSDFQQAYFYNKYAYRALVQDLPKDVSLDVLIQHTYNLEGVPVLPCGNDEEYGEFVLENGLLDELNDISDDVYEMIDRRIAGKIMRERENGVFIGEYYIVKSSYEPIKPEEITQPQVQDWLVKFRVTTPSKVPFDLQLPYAENPLGAELSECSIEWEDVFIPGLYSLRIESAAQIPRLNELMNRLTKLSHDEFVKFKAICETNAPHNIEEAESILSSLDKYEIDLSVSGRCDYGKLFLEKILPPDFNRALLKDFDSHNFAKHLAVANGAVFTEYGMLSAEGMKLYAMPETDSEQSETENFDIRM